MNVPEGTPMDTSPDMARCLPPGQLRQEYLVLLELVGHGRFQLRLLFCAHLSLAMVLFHRWSIHVLTRRVDHWCKPPALFAHLTREQWFNVSIPVVEDGRGNRRHSRCTMYDLAAIIFNGTRVEVPCVDWEYDLPHDTQTVISKWNLVCDREPYLVTTFVYYTLSGVLGTPLLGQMADRVGRKPVVFTALLATMSAVFVATVADSFTIFVVAHVVIATSSLAVNFMISILLFESSSSASRTLYIAAAQTAVILVHSGSLCPWLQRVDLRLLSVTLVMSMVLLSLAFHAVSESPRWLLAEGRYDALTSVIMRLARENGVDLGDVWRLVHYAEVVKPLLVLMEVLFAVVQLCLLIAKLQAYECFPSAVRATGVTVLVAAGLLGDGAGELLLDIARLSDPWTALLVIAAGLLACQLAIRWLPETKDVELPEVQREVLGHGHLSPPREPLLTRRTRSFAQSDSHHTSTAESRTTEKRTHSSAGAH